MKLRAYDLSLSMKLIMLTQLDMVFAYNTATCHHYLYSYLVQQSDIAEF